MLDVSGIHVLDFIDDQQRGFIEDIGILLNGLFERFQYLPFELSAFKPELNSNRVEDAADTDGRIRNAGNIILVWLKLIDKGADSGGFSGANLTGNERNPTPV